MRKFVSNSWKNINKNLFYLNLKIYIENVEYAWN